MKHRVISGDNPERNSVWAPAGISEELPAKTTDNNNTRISAEITAKFSGWIPTELSRHSYVEIFNEISRANPEQHS